MLLRLALFFITALQAQPIWKTYPVYHPDQAPPGYIEWLRSQQPEQISNPTGDELFNAPVLIGSLANRPPSDPPFLTEKTWFEAIKPPLTREGAITGFTYVLRTKGKIEIGTYSCALCHSRVLSNGAVIIGAPGNFPIDAAIADDVYAAIPHAALREANKAILARGSLSKIPDITGASVSPAYIAQKQQLFNPAHTASPEQLQAIAAYVKALKQPPSPYKPDKYSRLGEKIYASENCAQCHPQKAPSLNGLWYRGVALEELLSPARLSYQKGHEYGFKLSAADRAALIAYLRTL
jgi:mono/diheme cytochrome c family protein